MKDSIFYDAETGKISEQNMQFAVISCRPGYQEEKESVKAEIENQLYAVFSRYSDSHV